MNSVIRIFCKMDPSFGSKAWALSKMKVLARSCLGLFLLTSGMVVTPFHCVNCKNIWIKKCPAARNGNTCNLIYDDYMCYNIEILCDIWILLNVNNFDLKLLSRSITLISYYARKRVMFLDGNPWINLDEKLKNSKFKSLIWDFISFLAFSYLVN
jgi:hypothetical protein